MSILHARSRTTGRLLAALALTAALAVAPAAADDPPFGLAAELDSLAAPDRVSGGENLTPDGTPDVRYWVRVTAPGEHTIDSITVSLSSNIWNTTPGDTWWALGVTDATGDDAVFLNEADQDLSLAMIDERALYLYMADNGSQVAGNVYDVEVCIDGLGCETVPVDTGAAPDGDGDGDGYRAIRDGDCDDGDPLVNPGATEVADNDTDDDCDGFVDETDGGGDPDPDPTWYLDGDGDTYGDPATTTTAPTQPTGYVADDTDCDDGDDTVNPGATEEYNGYDDDCDGDVDEGFSAFYADSDGDGFGDPAAVEHATTQPVGYVDNGDDCDDADATVNPDAADVPGDGIDQDCSGADAVPSASEVTYTGASNGVWTNKKTTVSLNAAIAAHAACLAGRSVTFTLDDVEKTVTSRSDGTASAQFTVANLANVAHLVTVSLAESPDGWCAADEDGDQGSWVYTASKPRK